MEKEKKYVMEGTDDIVGFGCKIKHTVTTPDGIKSTIECILSPDNVGLLVKEGILEPVEEEPEPGTEYQFSDGQEVLSLLLERTERMLVYLKDFDERLTAFEDAFYEDEEE